MTGAVPEKTQSAKPRGRRVQKTASVTKGTQRTVIVKPNTTKKAKPKSKFVLVYQGLKDPDAATVQKVAAQLAPAKVKEVLPGTLRVEGDGAAIKQRADQLDSWQLAQEGLMSNTSPTETKFNYLRT